MGYQTAGQALMQPINEAMRNRENAVRDVNRFTGDQQRLALQSKIAKAKINIARAQLSLANGQLQERIREFNERQKQGVGTGRQGIFMQAQNNLFNQVAQDNPQIANDPTKLREAVANVIDGKYSLSDGTPLNVSGLTKGALDDYAKTKTTAPLLTSQVSGNQGEAEQSVLNYYITKYTASSPYGTTYFKISPQQISDQFKDDDESQKQLGEFLAANMLQYESAQIQQRLAGAKPSLGGLNEIMSKSPYNTSVSNARLSGKARTAYTKALEKVMKELMDTRNKVGVGARQTLNYPQSQIAIGAAGNPSSQDAQSSESFVTNEDIEALKKAGLWND